MKNERDINNELHNALIALHDSVEDFEYRLRQNGIISSEAVWLIHNYLDVIQSLYNLKKEDTNGFPLDRDLCGSCGRSERPDHVL